ncbi:tyrosyl-DNA phosphodiesterase 1-like isoform X2 [Rhopilema esculentum]|uniref:tyrosyl-DNA phosphodiesterase 1-like isoform X2 n=1 Tax=Rhopilema esculentum TaxID=499914 RepID=UPI0031E08418
MTEKPALSLPVKRQASCDIEENANKPMCKYGEKCYRKNPQHFKEFQHPKLAKRQKLNCEELTATSRNHVPLYVTSVRGISAEYNQKNVAIGIKDILSEEDGDLEASAQFNYMFDLSWLMQQYPVKTRRKPLLIVHGDSGQSKANLEAEAAPFKNIEFVQAELTIPYGTHHSKMMFLLYNDGLKVVIHTANLIEQDWDQKTQGVWVSPKFPKLSTKQNQDNLQNDEFKKDLLEYLDAYGSSSKLDVWRNRIKDHDMTGAKARIVASVPGRHVGISKYKWGHLRLRSLLELFGPDNEFVDRRWPVLGQFSSIGSLGPDEKKWLCAEWLESLAAVRRKPSILKANLPDLKLIFPSLENVRTSLEGYKAGGSLPYADNNARKQLYLLEYFHQWKSTQLGRTRASPHIKSYSRISPDSNEAAWFLLTSANLSKAAWGAFEKKESQLMIRSFEIGVLMIPQQFSSESKSFNILGKNKTNSGSSYSLQLPYDVPLTAYLPDDSPWIWDRNYLKPDSLSGTWMPRR